MQSVCPHVPPEPIHTHLRARSPGSSYFEYPACHPQSCVSRNNLDASHPFRNFTTLSCRYITLLTVVSVDVSNFCTGLVSKSLGRAEVRQKIAIAFKDIELVCCGFFVVSTIGPGTGVFCGVFRSKGQSANGNAKIEIGKD